MASPNVFRVRPVLSLLHEAKPVRFRKHEIIYSTGDSSDSLFYVEKGSVKLTLTSKEGKEAVVEVVDGGGFFGELSLDPRRLPRPSDAITLTEVHAAKIERSVMLHLLHTNQQMNEFFLLFLVRQIARMKEEHADSILYSSEKRLALVLASIAKLGGDGQSQTGPRLSQQDLANMLGLSRQRVNILMKRFLKLGFIEYARGGLRVHGSIANVGRKGEPGIASTRGQS
jgi:CRP/FNR family cyclic AMP-dependent transcriptional regulator